MRRNLVRWAAVLVAVLSPALVLGGDSQDTQIAERIATVLRDSGRMRNYSVGVKYKNGTVWLSGRVASDEQLQSALQVVSNIDGVQRIVNGMSVSGPKAGLKQPLSVQTSARSATRRVSATSADLAAGQPDASESQAAPGGDVTPAGYHHLQRAARHAPPAAMYMDGAAPGPAPALDQPAMPAYAWPSYAAYPNYAALTYPKQYSPTAWPFIGPFYPYPQVPLGWRKVALEWDDGWWFLDFYDRSHH